jgi:hypothetical protein
VSEYSVTSDFESIGRNLRDSCNNRLQEILAMATATHIYPDTVARDEAYSRIVSAVQDIAGNVNALEGRLLDIVESGLTR